MDDIEIVDYDPRWPLLFDEEARGLRAALDPSLIVGLEHFGRRAGHLCRSVAKARLRLLGRQSEEGSNVLRQGHAALWHEALASCACHGAARRNVAASGVK